MLSDFTTPIIKNNLNNIKNIENQYIIFSNFNYEKFIELKENINKFKINFMLLFNDDYFFIKLRSLSCEKNEEIKKWNINHYDNMNNIYKNQTKIIKLFNLSNYIGIINNIQIKLLIDIHKLICNIYCLNKIYYKDKNDKDGNPIILIKPSKNQVKLYFDLLEITLKILTKYYNKYYFAYHFRNNKSYYTYQNIVNDQQYLQQIEDIKNKI